MANFTVIDAPQRSPEWFQARLGRVTGSVAGEMCSTRKDGKEAAGRRDLRTRLALERLTGQSCEDDYLNGDMRRGIALEPDAIAAYEVETGQIVQFSGFLSHTEQPIGSSLDGHVGDFAGIVEFKCPRPAIHLGYIRAGVVPAEYRHQLVHNLLVSGAGYADFCSFCPQFPEAMQLFRVRVHRDEAEIASYQLILSQFLRDVDAEYAEIQRLSFRAVAA